MIFRRGRNKEDTAARTPDAFSVTVHLKNETVHVVESLLGECRVMPGRAELLDAHNLGREPSFRFCNRLFSFRESSVSPRAKLHSTLPEGPVREKSI